MCIQNAAAATFTFIVVPDTQKLAADHPDIYSVMTQSIVKHSRELGADLVLHLGDVVDNGGVDESQYKTAAEALRLIDEAGIPLLIAPGNHDYDIPVVSANGPVTDEGRRELSMFNHYFGLHRFRQTSWFGGAFEEGKAENIYALPEAGGLKLLALVLEFAPRDAVMAWADRMLRQHRDRQAVVITHSYMYMYGERISPGDRANPKTKYFAGTGCNDGEDMWLKHLRHHPNLVAVFSGHHVPVNVSHRVDSGIHGNKVAQLFQNWQSEPCGGSGRYRVVQYDAARGTMAFQVFNPLSGQFEAEPGYSFVCEAGGGQVFS